jgi:hypothetical protein
VLLLELELLLLLELELLLLLLLELELLLLLMMKLLLLLEVMTLPVAAVAGADVPGGVLQGLLHVRVCVVPDVHAAGLGQRVVLRCMLRLGHQLAVLIVHKLPCWLRRGALLGREPGGRRLEGQLGQGCALAHVLWGLSGLSG